MADVGRKRLLVEGGRRHEAPQAALAERLDDDLTHARGQASVQVAEPRVLATPLAHPRRQMHAFLASIGINDGFLAVPEDLLHHGVPVAGVPVVDHPHADPHRLVANHGGARSHGFHGRGKRRGVHQAHLRAGVRADERRKVGPAQAVTYDGGDPVRRTPDPPPGHRFGARHDDVHVPGADGGVHALAFPGALEPVERAHPKAEGLEARAQLVCAVHHLPAQRRDHERAPALPCGERRDAGERRREPPSGGKGQGERASRGGGRQHRRLRG